jgi:hypothetical protein
MPLRLIDRRQNKLQDQLQDQRQDLFHRKKDLATKTEENSAPEGTNHISYYKEEDILLKMSSFYNLKIT